MPYDRHNATFRTDCKTVPKVMRGPVFLKSSDIEASLIHDGWGCPDTYSNHFRPIRKISAVYLFLMVDKYDLKTGLVAYVGMSTNLQQRMSGHEMNDVIGDAGYYSFRWFKPVARDDLRETERFYIKKFDPPWNIIGKTKGLAFK